MPDEPVTNLPGFGVEPTMAAQCSRLAERLLQYCEWGLDGLTVEQISDSRGGLTNSIGWDVWHVVRTVDNIVHFVFDREQPVWLRDNFDQRWGLPRVDQGTGMEADTAYGLKFPEPAEFSKYTRAVSAAVVPRIAAMSDAYLAETMRIRPWGMVPRMEAVLHGLIGHGNGHLGRVSLARELYGKKGLAY
ncbi:MAG: DinB family protein [Chloroflexi bacterium]|nr:DinB family protein [Chloroflexota bacterium]